MRIFNSPINVFVLFKNMFSCHCRGHPRSIDGMDGTTAILFFFYHEHYLPSSAYHLSL